MRAARRCVAARAYDAAERDIVYIFGANPLLTELGAVLDGSPSRQRKRRAAAPESRVTCDTNVNLGGSALHNAGPRLRAAGSRCVPGAVNGHPRDRWTCGR